MKKRRDRAIAIVLGVKEREIDKLMPRTQQGERASRLMRKVILDQFNDFYDFCLDVAGSEAESMAFNPQVWEERLARFDDFLERLESDPDLTAEQIAEIVRVS